ncbi:MAG: hypothetical protein IID34_12680 [Planctomycetes bacterium]|nr:hypothetical protein [Planctomycetota bacterium]
MSKSHRCLSSRFGLGRITLAAALVLMASAGVVRADEPLSTASLDELTSFRLPFPQDGDGGGGEEDWDISGPVRMRSADPEETGELAIKNIFGYSTSSHGDDDFEYELELEWGFMPDHHLILELPVEIGDGEVEGNADLTLGWHWRLWREQDWMPAFAMRNLIRIPSGVDSDGVDYEFRGLFTKTITPNQLRLQFSPSFKVVNGDIHAGERPFQWELYAGFDYRLSDATTLNLNYLFGSSASNGASDQHAIELGVDWDIADHQMLALGTRLGLDGDSEGDNWGIKLSYIISIDAPTFGG